MRLLKLLSFLDKNSYADCIICKKRKRKEMFRFCETGIGICRDCEDELPFVSVGQMSGGLNNIEYYLSVFYYTDTIRKSIIEFKFDNCHAYGKIFSYYMSEVLKGVFCEDYDFNLIVSVPLSKERFMERGFNQTDILAQHISENIGVAYIPDALEKIRDTKRQSELSAVERMTNLKDAFRVNERLIRNRRILLIDDVYTSGNTAIECAKELKRGGAEAVIVFTLARKPSLQKSREYIDLFGSMR